jgi:hypothetical protein
MEMLLATAMPRGDWTVPVPLGCVVLLVQARMALWFGSVVVLMVQAPTQARMGPWLGSVVVLMVQAPTQARMGPRLGPVVVLMVQARIALSTGFVAASKLIEKPGAQAERWPAEQ